MLRQAHKVGPGSLGAPAGTTKIITRTIATHHEGGKTRPQNHAPLPVWPKPGHPFYRELRLDRNYVWDRMLGSVSPTKFQLSGEVPYES